MLVKVFLQLENNFTYYNYSLIAEKLLTKIAEHLTTYFYWLSSQSCNFSKVQHRLPDDGPNGPKHVGAIMRYFNHIF